MKQQIEWIESGGGPLLFAPRSALAEWHGSTSFVPGAVSDYQRACRVTDEIDAIPIGNAQALVLGDEPDRSALIVRSPTNVLILRWRWAPSEEALLSVLDLDGIDRLPSATNKAFKAVADQYLLFDSACSGAEIVHALQGELTANPYWYDTVDYRPNADTCLLIHRLRVKAG